MGCVQAKKVPDTFNFPQYGENERNLFHCSVISARHDIG